MSRTVVVEAGSPLLKHFSTQILFSYANGESLVETNAPKVEAGRDGAEIETNGGLALEHAHKPEVEKARDDLDGLPAQQRIAAYVELRGPADANMLAALRTEGIAPQQYVPSNTYLCTGTAGAFRKARALPFVSAVTPLLEEVKARARANEAGPARTLVFVVATAAMVDAGAFSAEIGALDDIE